MRKAKSKAQTPFDILCDEPEEINPAIILAEELMRRDISENLDYENFEAISETLSYSRSEIGKIEQHFAALVKTPGAASSVIPAGF